MKNLARIRWVLFAVAAGASAAAVTMVGCSSDDSTQPPNDASTDGNKPDGNRPDTGPVPGDAGLDSRSNFDVGAPKVETWVEQVTRLYCLKAAQCCGPSNFNVEKCILDYQQPPSRGAVINLSSRPYLDGGNMRIDPDRAQKCYDDINALSCGQTAGALRQTYDDCVRGAVGTVAGGAFGCKGSPECAPENHCDLPSDGGKVGICNLPRELDAGCSLGLFDYEGNPTPGPLERFYEPQSQCGYLVTGKPRYCANADTNVGWLKRDGGTSHCANPVATGQPCYQDVECQSNYCDLPANQDLGTCSDSPLIGTQDLCDQERLDAGDGGG